nr:MAG TPA: hypothetical protein [Bacteriophage sp.]
MFICSYVHIYPLSLHRVKFLTMYPLSLHRVKV